MEACLHYLALAKYGISSWTLLGSELHLSKRTAQPRNRILRVLSPEEYQRPRTLLPKSEPGRRGGPV